MKKKTYVFSVIVALLLFASAVTAGNPGETRIISYTGESVLLNVGYLHHRLSYKMIDGKGVVVDTIFYFQPPTSPMSYNDFMAGYQGAGDTCINWFTMLAPGKVTKLMMQNASAGTAYWFIRAPAIVEENYQFPSDVGLPQLLDNSVTQFCYATDPNMQFIEGEWAPEWNTNHIEARGDTIVLSKDSLGFWVGYSMDSNGGPTIWQDGVFHNENVDGSCRSFSTLHSQTIGKWYRNVQPGTGNWVAHMMQIEVVYESIPPMITDLPDLCDTFSESRTIRAQVIELEGEDFEVKLNFKTNRSESYQTVIMEPDEDDYFWAIIAFLAGDTVFYNVQAEDSSGLVQISPGKSFVCVKAPQNTEIIIIDDSGLESGGLYREAFDSVGVAYFYWNMEDHNGIDTTVLHYSGFQTMIVSDGDNRIVPVTDVYEQDIYNIAGFLDSGGNLMLVDMDYLYRWNIVGAGRFETGDFAYDYLGIEDYTGDPDDDITLPGGSADSLMLSVSNNPVTSAFSTDTTTYGPVRYRLNGVENWADFIEPTLTASGILKGKTSGKGMAVCLDGSHFRTITFAFPIELAADLAEFVNLLDSSLQWLGENTTRLDSASGLIQEEQAQVPQSSFRLNANYPNPFNPTTVISFSLLREETVDLTVYNIKGEFVGTLVHRTMTPGNYTIDWTAVNERGISLPSGIYFYSLSTKKQSVTKKMILLR